MQGTMLKRTFLIIAVFAALVVWRQGIAEDTPRPPKTTPPRYSVSPVVRPSPTPTPIRIGPNLVKNGDFSISRDDCDSPANWELVDGLTTFYDFEEGHGKLLRVDTAVPKEQARERWLEIIEHGPKAPPPPSKEPLKGIYASIGAYDGVRHDSDPIPAKKGAAYYLKVDLKCAGAPKVFVKGFGTVVKKRNVRQPDGSVKEVTVTEERQVFEWYLACRKSGSGWETFGDWISSPMRQDVDYLVIGIYSYWPNGLYYWDNIEFYEGKYPQPKPSPSPSPAADPEHPAAAARPAVVSAKA